MDSLGIFCSNNGICVEMLITPSETHMVAPWHLVGVKMAPIFEMAANLSNKINDKESVANVSFMFLNILSSVSASKSRYCKGFLRNGQS